MSYGIPIAFNDKVTDISATAKYPVGTLRRENGKLYEYQQADDAITAGQFVKLDYGASDTGKKVTPTGAITDHVHGVAETAITDEYFGWITIQGGCDALVANGVAAGQRLFPTATAGTLDGTAADVSDASVAHDLNSTFSDTEAEAALNALGTKINSLLDFVQCANARPVIAMEANSSGGAAAKAVYLA